MTIVAPPAERPVPEEAPQPPGRAWPEPWFAVLAFVGAASVVVAVSVLAHAHLPLLHKGHGVRRDWAHAFGWWDGWWYVGIARRGYGFFSRRHQSPVAFFPAYPVLMHLMAGVVGSSLRAGIVLSLACGLGTVVAFHRWCVLKMGAERARLAVLALVAYPFAFYLMGAVYADSLFLFAAIGAFVALELDRPVLAGLAAAVATASRPVGAALVLGLWVLSLERKGVLATSLSGRRIVVPTALRSTLRWGDAGLLLAPMGLVAYCGFLWARFGRPLAFLDANAAHGWDQPQGPHTWFKVHWAKAMWHGPWNNGHFGHLALNAAVAVLAIALVPRVFRRFGLGYGVFVTVAVVCTAVSTKDFVGMGRYTLAAFPCFAVAGELLYRRPRVAVAVLSVSGLALLMLAQLHARGTILS